MTSELNTLMEQGILPPLAVYFARFVAGESGLHEDHWVVRTAALVSARNLEGDVCVDLRDYSSRPLFPEAAPWIGPTLETWLGILKASRCVGEPGENRLLILEGSRVYLARHWRDEQQVAEAVTSRLQPLTPAPQLRTLLECLFPPADAEVTDWQKAAAAMAVTRLFAVVAGGPGTGKTTTVIKILALLLALEPDLRIALATPTGKAAARLSEAIRAGKGQMKGRVGAEVISAIPEQAVTVHRLLGVSRGRFVHTQENRLAIDCLVLDEASMVDQTLMARLTEALPAKVRLILLGDRDQLASVDAGSVLGDITGHGREIVYSDGLFSLLGSLGIPLPDTVRARGPVPPVADAIALLRKSWRFDESGGIGRLASAVNSNDPVKALDCLDGDNPDLDWLEQSEATPDGRLIEWAASRYATFLDREQAGEAIGLFDQVQVLAALRKGPWGVEELNRRIEASLQRRALIAAGREYHGLPIMITRNDYETGLFNGDTGLLWRNEKGYLEACFRQPDGSVRCFPVRSLPDWEPAWALTVHKSQGSEFDQVLLVLPPEPCPVLTRELIYTGITRARKLCTLAGSRQTFAEAIKKPIQRASGLKEKLGWE